MSEPGEGISLARFFFVPGMRLRMGGSAPNLLS